MEIAQISDISHATWDQFCDASDDAWFWHTTAWINYIQEFAGDHLIAPTSFAVQEGGRLLAVAPCFALNSEKDGPWLGMVNEPSPWPAIASGLSARQVLNIEKAAYGHYLKIADEFGLRKVSLFGPVHARSFYTSKFPPPNQALRYGYTGAVQDTQVIDLSLDEDQLWQGVRKGHKTSIKTGRNALDIKWWCGDIDDDDFNAYVELHAKASGRKTRASTTFEMMKSWVRQGNGMLVGGKIDGQWAGFLYLIFDKKVALYASACNAPDLQSNVSVGHALLWEGILQMKAKGAEIIDLGIQSYNSEASDEQGDKMVQISRFKRGFGGFPMPRMIADLNL